MLLLDVWTPLLALKVINYEKIKERARERKGNLVARADTCKRQTLMDTRQGGLTN